MHRIKTHVNPTVRESCSTSACVRLRPCDSRRTILDWEQFLHFLRISCWIKLMYSLNTYRAFPYEGGPWVTHVAGATLTVVGTWVGPLYLVHPQTTTQVNCFILGSNPGTWSNPSGMTGSLFEWPQNCRRSIPEDQKIHKPWAEVKISVHLSGYHKCDQTLRQLTCQVKADIHQFLWISLYFPRKPLPKSGT